MQYLIYVIIMIVALILQVTIFSFYSVWGITPDLLLIIVISLALVNGYRWGAYMGFVAGFFQDIFSGGFFGINIIIKLILGYGFGFFERKVYHKNIVIPIVSVVVATIFSQFLFVILTDHVMLKIELWTRFKEIIMPLVALHILLSLIIYPLTYYINNKFKK